MSVNEWQNGPDEIQPAESNFSNTLNQPVRLRFTEIDHELYPPISIYSMFQELVEERPEHEALAYRTSPNDDWIKLTYEQYWDLCHKSAKSFIKLGLGVSQCVSILGFNSPQWFMSQLGAIFAGGVGCGIYTTNSLDIIEYILNDNGSKIVVVENNALLEKIIKCKDKINLTKIIQYSGTVENDYDGLVMHWDDFIEYGSDVDDAELERRIKTIAPNKCASLIYTSGTTGKPKAAMISHDNITYTVQFMGVETLMNRFSDKIISYLPLSHIAAQILDLYAPLHFGHTIYFAQPDALKGSLLSTLKEVRPTFFFGVPRVYEKIQEGVQKKIQDLSGFKLSLFKWCQKIAFDETMARFNGQGSWVNLSYQTAKLLVLNNLYYQLGFDQCRVFYSSAAPLSRETHEFFVTLGIPLCEIYGMSEITGPHSLCTFDSCRLSSCGRIRELNLSKIDDKNGELLVKGRHVFMGYLNESAKTLESFDTDEWFRTGDMGKIEEDFIFITGRIKELIITAGGENIAPVPIEDNLKAELSELVSNCMLVGDKRKYLTILVTLKSKIDLSTMTPTDELTPECVEFLKSKGSKSKLVSEIVDKKDPIVYKLIEEGIKRANEKSVSQANKVQKFHVLEKDFSVTNGELGPTMKLRRPIVTQMYAQIIDNLYKDN